MTPTDGDATTGRTGQFLAYCRILISIPEFIRNLSRQDRPEDPKRLAVIISASALALGFLIVVSVLARQGCSAKPIDSGLAAFAGSLALILSGLAGYVHRKPDDPLPPGGAQ